MKIREVHIRNFRNFGPNAGAVSFIDPLTQQVRPLSVLVGSNGCGKTTVLDTIEGLLSFAVALETRSICGILRDAGYADMRLDFRRVTITDSLRNIPEVLRIALGRKEYAPDDYLMTEQIAAIDQRGVGGRNVTRDHGQAQLQGWVRTMMQDKEPLTGGLIYLPHRRWVEHEQKGAIEEPSRARKWLFRFDPDHRWEGSLSQLWVWQNYLDLEQGREGRQNLTPFVAAIEAILGRDRTVMIRGGRVHIERPGREALELHELPSGEQQILTMFGEIIRQIRPGGVLIIDEVEISLHPALQRVVLHHLRELAARYDLQIILTTHSMEIVAAVAPDELVNLDDMVLQERAQSGGAA